MDANDLQTRFFKHRRNMLLISGIFVFLILSGGTIDKINVLGSIISFSNPDIPAKIFFISVLYMLIKYFQFLSEMCGTGFIRNLQARVHNKVRPYIKAHDDNLITGKTGLSETDYNVVMKPNSLSFLIQLDTTSGRVKKFQEETHSFHIPHERYFGIKELWKEYLKGILYILFRTVWFAEYILPVVLAVSGVILFFFPDLAPTISWSET